MDALALLVISATVILLGLPFAVWRWAVRRGQRGILPLIALAVGAVGLAMSMRMALAGVSSSAVAARVGSMAEAVNCAALFALPVGAACLLAAALLALRRS